MVGGWQGYMYRDWDFNDHIFEMDSYYPSNYAPPTLVNGSLLNGIAFSQYESPYGLV